MRERSGEPARLWIEGWIRTDMDRLHRRLSPDCVHVSPFGRLEDLEPPVATVAEDSLDDSGS